MTSSVLDELERWLDGPLAQARERRELGEALGEAVDALTRQKQAIRRLEELSTAADTAARVGCLPDEGRLSRLLGDLGRLASRLETAADAAELHALTSRLEDLPAGVRELRTLFEEAWSTHCSRRFEEHKALGALLQRLQPTRELGGRMVTTASKGVSLGRSFPPDDNALQSLQRQETEVRRQEAELAQAGITPAVVGFLRKAAAGRATLLDADGEPLTWLKKFGGLGSVKLSLK